MRNAVTAAVQPSSRPRKRLQKDHIRLYLLFLPVAVWYIIFQYVPMGGLVIAFQDFKPALGIAGSRWVGLKHFLNFFESYNFWMLIENTFTLSLYSLAVGFPIPILLALMLNEIRQARLKKAVQTILYAPHFISTVVMVGILVTMLSPSIGVVNTLRARLGLERIYFMTQPSSFRHLYVWSGVWQGMGWSSIIYISALSGVDPQTHEAAIIDGATKVQRMIHVDLPAIKPTVVMLLILQLGSLMNVGFEKVYLLKNSLNQSASAIISTYTYEVGLINSDYGYSTAVGLFNSVINVILLVGANWFCKKVADESLF